MSTVFTPKTFTDLLYVALLFFLPMLLTRALQIVHGRQVDLKTILGGGDAGEPHHGCRFHEFDRLGVVIVRAGGLPPLPEGPHDEDVEGGHVVKGPVHDLLLRAGEEQGQDSASDKYKLVGLYFQGLRVWDPNKGYAATVFPSMICLVSTNLLFSIHFVLDTLLL